MSGIVVIILSVFISLVSIVFAFKTRKQGFFAVTLTHFIERLMRNFTMMQEDSILVRKFNTKLLTLSFDETITDGLEILKNDKFILLKKD